MCAVDKPFVPQFSVKFIDNSYNVPPTQTKDPYTGETTTQPSYIVKEGRIDVTINNLPSTSHNTSEGYECNLYYRVQYKGHYEETWATFSIMYYGVGGDYHAFFVAPSDDKYTVVSHSFNDFDTPPSGAQLDFRVQALYAYHDPTTINHMAFTHEALLVEEISGDWSNVQTITMNYGASSSSPSQTAYPHSTSTSDIPNLPQQNQWLFYVIIILVMVCIIIIPVAIVAYINKQRKSVIIHLQ